MPLDPSRMLPESAAARAREFLAGSEPPPAAKDAASTILLRSGADGLEVFLLRRRKAMAFAGGMVVFPGGGVDPRDTADAVAWAGPEPAAWAARLDVDEDTARGLVCAAARELFEEAGVLLAGPDDASVVTDPGTWVGDRRRLEDREIAFSDFLRDRRLVLRTDLLAAWSCWITPEFEARRYRTWFFAAEVPAGQDASEGTSEADAAVWMSVEAALAGAGETVAMLPPQYCTCLELAGHPDAAAAVAAARAGDPPVVMPYAVDEGDDGVVLELPERYRDLAAGR
jgi:8-oxo-dGTP pyrophosphatase MutT (NUDIX family)